MGSRKWAFLCSPSLTERASESKTGWLTIGLQRPASYEIVVTC